MLDIETKRRIDTARDILVGKVPDPKSQVEQISIALIYKFMDDMDMEAEELGGVRKFFADDYARYGWAKLMHSGLGGNETLNLYAEAIAKMPENPGIPALFRDIFKNAYLPYRDPETLRAFLKIIDEFEYDHSERLGDAFEYLLSVLGSQGDAGQFRTPRHIIDFIVAVVDPKKTETVLDPACGTAGFLISAYKHILKANSSPDTVNLEGGDEIDGAALDSSRIPLAPGDLLTADERERLAANFIGYDISPDMVRLSQVNLYLHGFKDPHIYEYDTLTSQDRWNEYVDVILANPPFMSPKGGIRPHNRFSVQSKRSEVLFVDYIAEHLTPSGRAGIIVPEGIIFQTQAAYTQLRKMLVEDYLVAVVSLPAGVFNPYSGVKTSILILDKSLAKSADTIGFFKIENDGFGLGAQRRPIERNDLPHAHTEIAEYLRLLQVQASLEHFQPALGAVVRREKITETGDYNLGGERYREKRQRSTHFPRVTLGEVTMGKPQYGSGASKVPFDGKVRYVRITDLTDKGQLKSGDPVSPSVIEPECFLTADDLLIARSGSVGRAYLHTELPGKFQFAGYLIRFRIDPAKAHPAFVYRMVQSPAWREWITSNSKTGTLTNINAQQFSSFEFPLPPLPLQKEIVAEIEGHQKVIDGARAVLDNYHPNIPINPDWPTVELAHVLESKPKNGYSGRPVDHVTKTKVLTLSATTSGRLDLTKFKYLDEEIPADAACRCRRGDIYLQRGNTSELVGTAALFDVDESGFIYPDLMIRVRADESKIISHYLLIALQSRPVREFLTSNAVGAAGSMPKINQSTVERIPIPLPPLTEQLQLVAEVDAEQALVAADRELIDRFEKKIQAALARIWGEDESVPAKV